MNLRYGLIATASITPRFLQAIRANGDEVVAIASRSLQKAEAFQKEHSIARAYGAYHELYEDEEVDVVYIASANHTHYVEAQNALMKKKHVVIEKPFTVSAKEALELFQYAQEQNCFLMEAQKSVFLPTTIRLKEMIDKKELGNLKNIHIEASFPHQYNESHWMYKKYGGVLYGSASYTLEYIMYLLNDPDIYAQALGVIAKQGALLDVMIQLQVNEDILVDSAISMRTKNANQAVFYFDHGSVTIPTHWKARKLIITKEDKASTEEFPVEFEMQYEIEHIHECIEQGLNFSPIMTPERTIVCTQIVDELITSLYDEE